MRIIAKGLGTILTLLAAAPTLAQFSSGNLVYTYETTTSGTITNASSDADCTSQGIARTFVVPDSFTYNSVSLGLSLSHLERGDISVYLQPPGGSATLLIDDGTNTEDHFDIMMSRNGEGGLTAGSFDYTTEPYYNRMVNRAALAAAPFTTGAANGTWTLYVCDRDDNGTSGTFNRARLVLTTASTATGVCTSRVTYDWGSNGDNDFTSATFNGITMTREATASEPAGEAVAPNQRTTTATFGGDSGYYQMRFLTTTATRDQTRFYSRFGFDVPVQDLQWGTLDCDTNGGSPGWEDGVRVYGTDATGGAGNRVPYQMDFAAAPSFQWAGDYVEGDTGNVPDADTNGNSTATFRGAVRSVSTEYWALNEPAELATQRIGIMDTSLCAFDFGDAPSSYGTPLSNGPKHVLGSRSLWLGVERPDGEADGQPNATAIGDDDAMIGTTDDEDGFEGLSFPTCPNTGSYSLTLRVNNVSGSPGYLVGFIDWNRDGDFADAGERSVTATVASGTTNGTQALNWSSVPANCGGTTQTFARFRFTTSQARAESPTDAAGTRAPDGEVEDYVVTAGTLPVTVARVESERDGDRLVVRWTTASEWANAGFRVWGKAGRERWRLLADVSSSNPDSLTPQHYETTVAGDGIDRITIEDVSLFGERRFHGPFAVGQAFGVEPEGMAIDWPAVHAETGLRAPRERLATSRGEGLRVAAASAASEGLLLVKAEGIQRITYEDLLAAGVDLGGAPATQIAVIDGGKGVARHVAAASGAFGPGSFVEFYARPQLTLASPVDAFTVRVDKKRAVEAEPLAVGAGAPVGVTKATDRYYADKKYSFSSPNGDPWYDQGLLARGSPAALLRSFDLPDLAPGAVQLTVKVWGYGAWPGDQPPDHHVVVLLNGSEIANGSFDDMVAWERTINVTNLVQASGNVLEVRVPGDTGYQHDYIVFEGFEVSYMRRAMARGGRFQGAATGALAVGGFAEGESVAIWRKSGRKMWRGERSAVGGLVHLPGGGEVWAATATASARPAVRAGVPTATLSSPAQYVIVTHPAFVGALAPLVALEQGRGYTTEVVTVDSIYAAYSDHAPSAEAIRRFLTTSIGKSGMRYALLVGADTADPWDHLGMGSVSFVPTAYLPYAQYVSFSPTDETLVDADGDGVGEVPIGRLPVRTPSELEAVIAKLQAWDANIGGAGRSAYLVAGLSDADSLLAPLNRAYASSLGTWSTTLASVDEQGAGAVRTGLLAAINAGTPLVSFVGHSSMGQWDSPSILRWQDVATFANAGRPNLVVQWGCWNSYYVEPTLESLAARMLRTPAVGAAASIGATTLTTDASHQALGTLFFRQVNGTARTVGEAFRNAKRELRVKAVAQDAILGMTLLGDPAMPLPR